jgi:hypothetical protein
MARVARPLRLENVAAIHNVILLLWSLAMFVFITLDIAAVYQREGLESLFCTSDMEQMRGRLFYGLYMYYISKFYELLDTIILVLKKVRVPHRACRHTGRWHARGCRLTSACDVRAAETSHFLALVPPCHRHPDGVVMGALRPRLCQVSARRRPCTRTSVTLCVSVCVRCV